MSGSVSTSRPGRAARRALAHLLALPPVVPAGTAVALVCAPALPAAALDTKGVPQPELQGKPIRTVTVTVRPVFEGDDLGLLYRGANALKIETKETVVRRELFFSVGDPYDDFRVRESERSIRSLRFLRDVSIRGTERPDGGVDLVVSAQDTWTFVPQLSYSNSGGQKSQSVGLAEADLLGYGKRVEVLARETDNRAGVETVYDDVRVWGTRNRLLAAHFDRDDGMSSLLYVGRPFRTLVDTYAWSVQGDNRDVVGRLFQNGDERYIFRQESKDLTARYTIVAGDPVKFVNRYSFGATAQEFKFSQADADDYDALDLDPSEVSSDPALLPTNRRFYGPSVGYQFIEQNFISMNYIDRFQRYEDYNIGEEGSVDLTFAPAFLGATESAVIVNANRSTGKKFSPTRFLRAEAGLGTRTQAHGFENSLVRGEVKYFDVLGSVYWGDRFLGRHTLAANFAVDYGNDLDGDREFIVGSGNGIRGYKARAFSGDKRVTLNLEDRVHLVDDVWRLVSIGAAAFVDAGGASRDTLLSAASDDLYSNVGVGLRFAFPRSGGGGVFRLDLAVPLREGPDGTGAFEPRIVLSAGQLFGARLRSEGEGAERSNIEVGLEE